jgi:hypothetical protein
MRSEVHFAPNYAPVKAQLLAGEPRCAAAGFSGQQWWVRRGWNFSFFS